MKRDFASVLILFALSSCHTRHHEQVTDQVGIEKSSVVDSSDGLGLVGFHYIVGDASDPNTQTIASAATSNRNGRHHFEELYDHRPIENQILPLEKVKGNLKDLVEDGSATLVVHASNADEIIAAAPEGIVAERVNQGYAKLIRSRDETPGLSEAEKHFGGPEDIVVIQLKKKSDPSVQINRPPLSITSEGNKKETTYKAYDANGVLVGMASVRTENRVYLSYFDIGDNHQGKGYGREFFNHVVKSYTDKGYSVSLVDASESSAGQKLYGGEGTLDNFDVKVNLKGNRQSYVLTKKSGNRGKRTYEDNGDDPTFAYGAIKYIHNDDYASGNAGSVAELMGYLKAYPDTIGFLLQYTSIMKLLETSLKQTREDGELDFYNALSDLQKMLIQYQETHPSK